MERKIDRGRRRWVYYYNLSTIFLLSCFFYEFQPQVILFVHVHFADRPCSEKASQRSAAAASSSERRGRAAALRGNGGQQRLKGSGSGGASQQQPKVVLATF